MAFDNYVRPCSIAVQFKVWFSAGLGCTVRVFSAMNVHTLHAYS